MPTRKTDPTPLHDALTPSEQRARTLTKRLQSALDAAHLKPQDDSWLPDWHSWAITLARVPWPEGDHPEREGLERRAAQGDIEALAGLIGLDLDYLKTFQVVLAIRVLQSHAVFARTRKKQQEAMAGLKALGKALLPDLTGSKCSPAPYDVARVYRDVLKAYQAVKRGEKPPEVRGFPVATGRTWDHASLTSPLPDRIPPSKGSCRCFPLPPSRSPPMTSICSRVKEAGVPHRPWPWNERQSFSVYR